ncbi:MAG: hypothetical protein ABSF95_10720 [Verrucomicrobiota bacterium]|jgi:hypothetical protein
MIALASDCLLFRLASGESVPLSAEMISVELMGETVGWYDAEFVRHVANAVFHYFREDLGLKTVTVGEFAGALEKVLRAFKPPPPPAAGTAAAAEVMESDLCRLAHESGEGRELFFFPRLRAELRHQMEQAPRVLRFRGLRRCVMELAGARRWTARCRNLEEQIVAYLRGCLTAEAGAAEFALVVE